jgi:hypothetical protein
VRGAIVEAGNTAGEDETEVAVMAQEMVKQMKQMAQSKSNVAAH